MVQRGEDLGFAAEPRDTFRVAGEGRGEHLQSDLATKLRVFGAIDLAHSALTDQREDFVGAVTCPGRDGHVRGDYTVPSSRSGNVMLARSAAPSSRRAPTPTRTHDRRLRPLPWRRALCSRLRFSSKARASSQAALTRAYLVATRAPSGSRYTGTVGRSSSLSAACMGRPWSLFASSAAAASRSCIHGSTPKTRLNRGRRSEGYERPEALICALFL